MKVYSLSQVSKMSGVPVKAILDLLSKGEGPAFTTNKFGIPEFTEAAIAAWEGNDRPTQGRSRVSDDIWLRWASIRGAVGYEEGDSAYCDGFKAVTGIDPHPFVASHS